MIVRTNLYDLCMLADEGMWPGNARPAFAAGEDGTSEPDDRWGPVWEEVPGYVGLSDNMKTARVLGNLFVDLARVQSELDDAALTYFCSVVEGEYGIDVHAVLEELSGIGVATLDTCRAAVERVGPLVARAARVEARSVSPRRGSLQPDNQNTDHRYLSLMCLLVKLADGMDAMLTPRPLHHDRLLKTRTLSDGDVAKRVLMASFDLYEQQGSAYRWTRHTVLMKCPHCDQMIGQKGARSELVDEDSKPFRFGASHYFDHMRLRARCSHGQAFEITIRERMKTESIEFTRLLNLDTERTRGRVRDVCESVYAEFVLGE